MYYNSISELRRPRLFFFFNDTATTEIYTLSLHDALPIWAFRHRLPGDQGAGLMRFAKTRSEEHTSELQSRSDLVCRLLLEKKLLTFYLAWLCAHLYYSKDILSTTTLCLE